MAGKGKGKRGKGGKSSKGTKAVVRGKKPSVNKLAKAANSCCPIIHAICAEVPGKKVKTLVLSAHTDSDGHHSPAKYKMVAQPNRTRCTVRLGSGKAHKMLDPAQKDDMVNKFKDALAAKRCIAVLNEN